MFVVRLRCIQIAETAWLHLLEILLRIPLWLLPIKVRRSMLLTVLLWCAVVLLLERLRKRLLIAEAICLLCG
jgi:hypothetical protein